MDQLTSIIYSSSFSSIVGMLAPRIFPHIFKLFKKILKRELDKTDKRNITIVVSIIIAVAIATITYPWKDLDFSSFVGALNSLWTYLASLFLGYAAMKGAIETVYQLIIKANEDLDKKLEEIAE